MHFSDLKPIKFFLGMMLFTLIHSSGYATAQDQTMEIVNRSMDQAKEYEELLTLPEVDKQGEKAARQAFDKFQSKEVQEMLEAEKKRIQDTFFSPFSPEIQITGPQENMCFDRLSETEKVFLFISSSIPLNTLKSYIRDIDTLGDPNFVIVMRGFIGGMKYIQPTLDFMENLLIKNNNCHLNQGKQCDMFNVNIEIDPLIFRKLHIQQVPAIAYVKNLKKIDVQQSMGREGNLSEDIDTVIIYGDSSLEFAMERIFEETQSPQIKKAMQTLRGDFYEE